MTDFPARDLTSKEVFRIGVAMFVGIIVAVLVLGVALYALYEPMPGDCIEISECTR